MTRQERASHSDTPLRLACHSGCTCARVDFASQLNVMDIEDVVVDSQQPPLVCLLPHGTVENDVHENSAPDKSAETQASLPPRPCVEADGLGGGSSHSVSEDSTLTRPSSILDGVRELREACTLVKSDSGGLERRSHLNDLGLATRPCKVSHSHSICYFSSADKYCTYRTTSRGMK